MYLEQKHLEMGPLHITECPTRSATIRAQALGLSPLELRHNVFTGHWLAIGKGDGPLHRVPKLTNITGP